MSRKPTFAADTSGAAAVELALWLGVLVLPILNVVDLGVYNYQRMQVENAAQMGAQAAWDACVSFSGQPKGVACGSTMTTAITAAVQSTSLGTNVTVVSGYPTEGAYCPDGSNALQSVASYKSSCAAAGYPAGTSGDYIRLKVSYTYKAIFGGASVASLLTTPIVAETWIRLG